jgi:hypothetical protein
MPRKHAPEVELTLALSTAVAAVLEPYNVGLDDYIEDKIEEIIQYVVEHPDFEPEDDDA